ncbi:MAG: GMC family oxidoreductase N-terminal domain-containing protein [Sinimarinibacterium sp.]|jgi:choline dehydrogenase-like flavoprotein
MSVHRAFAQRWLRARGQPESARDALATTARQRVRRYPRAVALYLAVGSWLVEFLFPLLLLGRWRRASGLDDADFEAFEQRAHHSRHGWIRATYLLARLPLWEQLHPEAPRRPAPHPLQARLAAVAPLIDGKTFDVVIVGSGAGGAPLAAELAGCGHRVAVLESGGLVCGETTGSALYRYYLQQGFVGAAGAGGALLPVMLGRNIGGTTPINSGTCLEPRRAFLEPWDRITGLPFSSGLLAPELARVRETIGICVPDRALLGPSAGIFERGLKALGRDGAYVLPRNTPECEGLGRCPFGCPRFHKRSMDISFLPLAVQRGARLHGGVQVRHIAESRAGVEIGCVLRDGRRLRLRARKCVLAGGALGTPRLIRGNRLGTRWREAGDQLKVHPAAKVLALMPHPVDGERGIAQGMGYLAPELPRVVFEGIFTPKGTVAPVLACAGHAADYWLQNYARAASFGMMVLDRAGGSVRWAGDQPLLRFSMHPSDVRDLALGMKLMAEAFFAAGAQRVLLPVVGMKNEFPSAAALDAFDPGAVEARHILGSGFHPQGTAAIGRVTDSDHRLHGCQNIFVSDASLLPDTPGVNPQVTIMALSLRLAGLMDAELR